MTLDSIIQWNCRGLASHYGEIKRLIIDHSPLAISLQETHLRETNSFCLRGYQCFRKDIVPDPGGRAHGGVAIYVRDNIPAKQVPLNSNVQAVAVEIKAPLLMTLVSIYLPDIYWVRGDLECLLSQLPAPVLVTGDFNSHNSWWGSRYTDARGRVLEEIIGQSNLILLNNGEPTHFNSGTGTFSAIDLSLATPSIATAIDWAPLNELYHSDHHPLLLTLSINKPEYVAPMKYKTENADWSSFAEAFTIPPASPDIDEQVENLITSIKNAASSTIPVTGGRIVRRTVPWWTRECKIANRIKKRAYDRFKRYPTEDNLINFKKCRAIERRILRSERKKSLITFVETIKSSAPVSEVWRKMQAITGKRRSPLLSSLNINGTLITDPRDLVETLGAHYSSSSSSCHYSSDFIQYKTEIEKTPIVFDATANEIYNVPFTMTELECALSSSKCSSPGPDGIPYEIIKHLPENGKEYLLHLYNQIWDVGYYPEVWRESIVIPIKKEGKDPLSPSSYRPISLTSCLGKLLESMINRRLVYVLETRNLINQHQAGFRKFHSCVDQLSLLENYIQDGFVNQMHTLAVFFDLEKAYDRTWKFGILLKCKKWGLRGALPKFIQSFLEQRFFRVRLGTTLSNRFIQENGIPQGSVLSVTLFVMAVNDILDGIESNIMKSFYVDDLALFLRGEDLTDVARNLQTAIDTIAQNADENGFTFSVEKTVCVHFCRKRKEHFVPTLTLQGSQLSYKNSIRFLGLTFDKKLYWSEHIEKTALSCKKLLNVFKFIANYNWGAEREIILSMINSLLRTKMEYGAPIFSSARESRLAKLDTLYNQALRIATGAFRTSPLQSIYVESSSLPPSLRREQITLLYYAKIWAKPNHFLHNIFFDSEVSAQYSLHTTRTRPLRIRALEYLQSSEIELGPVKPLAFPSTPPWTFPPITIRDDLARHVKEDTPPSIFLLEFRELLEEFKGYEPIFTDGSKIDTGVGSAVWKKDVTKTFTLPSYATIFTAELYAILMALSLCETDTWSEFLICTDSLSALRSLAPTSADPLIIAIYEKLHLIARSNKVVVFIWIPGHIGIPGNEKADQAAKLAALAPIQENIPVRPNDLGCLIKGAMKQKWQRKWDSTESKLKRFKPLVNKKSSTTSSRRKEIILTRIRIGHTRLTHGHLLLGQQPKQCSFCQELMSIEHLFEHCQALTLNRNRAGLSGNLPVDIKTPEKIMTFLYATRLFYEI